MTNPVKKAFLTAAAVWMAGCGGSEPTGATPEPNPIPPILPSVKTADALFLHYPRNGGTSFGQVLLESKGQEIGVYNAADNGTISLRYAGAGGRGAVNQFRGLGLNDSSRTNTVVADLYSGDTIFVGTEPVLLTAGTLYVETTPRTRVADIAAGVNAVTTARSFPLKYR
jgi:hypothetical protein